MKKVVLLGALATLLQASSAFAFCRTMTCDPNDPKQHCELDRNQCVLTGKPLVWPSSCVTVGVHAVGVPPIASLRHHYSYEDVAAVVEKSFAAWMAADCGSGNPSISVELIGPVECGVSEYSSDRANANILLFREDDWPYIGASNAIGLTTTRFDTKTGDLWDADIELNGKQTDLSIGDPITGDDLQSVLTHEAGHFLGLSHSADHLATMKAIYDPRSDGDTFRSLAPDDVAGICEAYPPARAPATTSCENRHGFSAQCAAEQPPPNDSEGCSVTRASGDATPASYATWLGLLAFCGTRLARRRRIV